MRILYAPDDHVESGEVLDDEGPLPKRYLSAVVLGLSAYGHDVKVRSLEARDPTYRVVRRVSRQRYERYIAYKLLRQACSSWREAGEHDVAILGRGTACALSLFPDSQARRTALVPVWYAPFVPEGALSLLRRRCGRKADALLCVSSRQAGLLAASLSRPVPVMTITMGVDAAFFSPSVGARDRDRVWICVGDAQRDDALIAAVAARLGGGVTRVTPAPIRPDLRSPYIRYEVGVSAEHLRKLYEESWGALVLTTSWSTIPGLTAMLEAMAMGLPVVATETVATREYLEDGQSGVVVGLGDLTGVLDAVNRISDPEVAARMGRHSRKVVEERHTIAAGTQQLALALEELPLR